MIAEQENEEEIESLQLLGLTQNQAKVYLALIKSENSTAKTLSNLSGLATCDVYRVIPELQKLGLLEVLVASPKEFRATPPEHAMNILCKQMEKQFQETQVKARKLLLRMESEKSCKLPDTSKMALIPGGYRATQFGLPKLAATKKRMFAVQTNVLFRRFINNTADNLDKLLKRKVDVRFVIESPEGIVQPDTDLERFLEMDNFRVRFFKGKIQACTLLHDNTDAFMSTSLDTIHTPSYWSNNPCVIAIVRDYFEMHWRKSFEKPRYVDAQML